MSAAQPHKPMFAKEHSIKEMTIMFNVTARTLRHYEKMQLLLPRRVGSVRHYSANDRARLQFILSGKKLGYTLGEILRVMRSSGHSSIDMTKNIVDVLTCAEIRKRLELLLQRRHELNAAIAELKDVDRQMETNKIQSSEICQ